MLIVAVPTPTRRPTRTPIDYRAPTRTPVPQPTSPGNGDNFDPHGLRTSCSLRRNIDSVTITLIVENNTGSDIENLTGDRLELEPQTGTLFFDQSGPNPRSYTILRPGVSAAFQWSGRLSEGGTMGFAASVAGTGPHHAPVQSGLVDCGVTSSESARHRPIRILRFLQIARRSRTHHAVGDKPHRGRTDRCGAFAEGSQLDGQRSSDRVGRPRSQFVAASHRWPVGRLRVARPHSRARPSNPATRGHGYAAQRTAHLDRSSFVQC